MRWRNSFAPALMLAASAIALWPAIAQRAPESILPPGFGEPDPPAKAAPKDAPPSDPGPDAAEPPAPLTPLPSAPADGEPLDGLLAETSNNMTEAEVVLVDLPPQARRSIEVVGLMTPADGGLAPEAYGTTDGRFLGTLMGRTNAPIASRWLSILLRRTLLSQSPTPRGVTGADWVAARALLLLRMGEADAARALVARVDSENFSPRLYDAAMQAALATGDVASLCNVANGGAGVSGAASWPMAQGMCAAMSGESGTASALVDRVRDTGKAGGIDVLLAEKVVGAGTNSRRSVGIQWDGVSALNAWRFGLAAATGVTIPPKLFSTVGPHVTIWHARAPLIAPTARATAAERAAAAGVFSSAALVDFFAAIWDATDPAERGGTPGNLLRDAYAASGEGERLSAMRNLWTADNGGDAYARSIMTARAALTIAPSSSVSADDADRLIASMLSAGLDIQAARWADNVARGSLGWGLLAAGAPRAIAGIDASIVDDVPGGEDDRRIKFLLAGLAGLGRLPADQANNLASEYAVPLGRENSWTRAIDAAAARGEAATVVVLAATGMQTREWRYVPPEHLYRIVAALRRVGLEPEARMIAAEALARA